MEATPLITAVAVAALTAILRVAAGRLVEGGSTEAKPQDSGFVPITGPVPELDHWKVSADTLKIQMLWCDGVMPNSPIFLEKYISMGAWRGRGGAWRGLLWSWLGGGELKGSWGGGQGRRGRDSRPSLSASKESLAVAVAMAVAVVVL